MRYKEEVLIVVSQRKETVLQEWGWNEIMAEWGVLARNEPHRGRSGKGRSPPLCVFLFDLHHVHDEPVFDMKAGSIGRDGTRTALSGVGGLCAGSMWGSACMAFSIVCRIWKDGLQHTLKPVPRRKIDFSTRNNIC